MDIISATSTLRQQVVSLHNSDITVQLLENQVTSLGRESLMSAIEENQSKHLRQLLRLSVVDGVHLMYQQYSTNKHTQVQNTAMSIKSSLEPDNSQQTTIMTSPPAGGSTRSDKAEAVWSSVFCELSRYE